MHNGYWSSDVCASDLQGVDRGDRLARHEAPGELLQAGGVRGPALRAGLQARGEVRGVAALGVRVEVGEESGQVVEDRMDVGAGDHERGPPPVVWHPARSEEHTSERQSLMRISYDVFC